MKKLKKKFPNVSFYINKYRGETVLTWSFKISFRTPYGKIWRTAELWSSVWPFPSGVYRKNAVEVISKQIEKTIKSLVGKKVFKRRIGEFKLISLKG